MLDCVKRSLCFIVFICLLLLPPTAFAASATKGARFSTAPVTKNGEKWRIGYLESGTYNNYYKSLKAAVEGLITLKWMAPVALPEKFAPADAEGLWQWLAANAQSDYIQFVSDAYWNQRFEEEVRANVRQEVIHRLNTRHDIDLMLVMGTKAGLDMATNAHTVPTVVGSTTNAFAAGIIKSVDDSGYDHVHAMVDLKLHEVQLKTFYDTFQFKRLGVAFRDSEVGRSTAGIDSVEKIARELGFDLVPCDLNTIIPGTKEHERKKEKSVKCYQQLATQADAVYITRYAGGVTLDNMANIMAPLNRAGLPTFSQAGAEEVSKGVLMSLAMSRFRAIGEFYAQTMAKVFNGAKPRELNQKFEQPARIAINLNTALSIGYDPSIEILAVADEIYE